MLRSFVIVLLLANVAFLAWSRGWLAPWLEPPAHGERAPERLAAQVRPEAISLLSARAASAAVSAAQAASMADGEGEQCLEAGPFSAAEIGAAQALLGKANIGAERWTRVERQRPPIWAVYLGPFADADAQRSRAEELKRLNIVGEPVKAPPALNPGLSLGRYESKAAAEAALPSWNERGIRNARAVALSASAPEQWLRFERSTSALRERLRTMKFSPAAAGLNDCRVER